MLFSFQFKIQTLSRIRITEIVLSVIGNTKVKGSKVIVVNNVHLLITVSFKKHLKVSFWLYCIWLNIRGLSDNRRPWKLVILRAAASYFLLEIKIKTKRAKTERKMMMDCSLGFEFGSLHFCPQQKVACRDTQQHHFIKAFDCLKALRWRDRCNKASVSWDLSVN